MLYLIIFIWQCHKYQDMDIKYWAMQLFWPDSVNIFRWSVAIDGTRRSFLIKTAEYKKDHKLIQKIGACTFPIWKGHMAPSDSHYKCFQKHIITCAFLSCYHWLVIRLFFPAPSILSIACLSKQISRTTKKCPQTYN